MKSCLVVDDSDSVRQVVRRILESFDLEVTEAANGREALDACGRDMPDGIVLDWNMPVMDGYDFLNQLRAGEAGSQPAVIFCTTESELSHIQAALSAGADEYIIKPFDIKVLREKLTGVGLIGAPRAAVF